MSTRTLSHFVPLITTTDTTVTPTITHGVGTNIGDEWVKSLTPVDIANLNLLKVLQPSLFTFLQSLHFGLRDRASIVGKPYDDWSLWRSVADAVFDKPAMSESPMMVAAPADDSRISELQQRIDRLESIIEDMRLRDDKEWGSF